MNILEAYWLLFTDTLVAIIFFTFKGEMINQTMVHFGIYDKKMIILISALAASMSGIINYLMGIMFYNIYKGSSDPILKQNYYKLQATFGRKRIWLLILNVTPIAGKFVM